jgi:hypothetical protein
MSEIAMAGLTVEVKRGATSVGNDNCYFKFDRL